MTTRPNTAEPTIIAIDQTLFYLHDDLANFCVDYAGDMTYDDWMNVSVSLAGILAEHLAADLGRDGAVAYLQHLRTGDSPRVWMGRPR